MKEKRDQITTIRAQMAAELAGSQRRDMKRMKAADSRPDNRAGLCPIWMRSYSRG